MKKYFGILACLLALACARDEEPLDVNGPVISEVHINGEEEHPVVATGSNMNLTAEVSDNVALKELKIEIHDIFDNHTHGKRAEWAEIIIVSLSGESHSLNQSIQVPGSATAGMYHSVLRALDAEGNESDFVELDFVLTNGNEPQISVSNPVFGQGEVHAPKGSTFDLQGSISEDIDLVEVIVRIVEDKEGDHGHKMQDGPLFMADYDLTGANDTIFDLSQPDINIPATAETGYYILEIIAKDSEGNYGLFMEEIHVM